MRNLIKIRAGNVHCPVGTSRVFAIARLRRNALASGTKADLMCSADGPMADRSPEMVRPARRKRWCWLSKQSNAFYGLKPRFMSQSG